MKTKSSAQNLSLALQQASEQHGNGTLAQIFLALGKPCQFEVHVWPSASPADAAFRRGIAYARSSFYLEDQYLLTPKRATVLPSIVSLYDRMRAGIHACLMEHGVTSDAGKNLLNESAQVILFHFGNEAFRWNDWENFAKQFDAHVCRMGGKPILPLQAVSHCTDSSAHGADRALLDRLDQIGLGVEVARRQHLSVVKPAPAPDPA